MWSQILSHIRSLYLAATLRWSENDYSGSETAQSVQGLVSSSVTLAMPVQVRVTLLTYDEARTMPGLMLPDVLPPMSEGEFRLN